MVLQFVLVALLVLLNGFFVAAEFSLVKIRETQLQALLKTGNRRAKAALEIVGKLDAALSATQLGITIASLGLGWLGKPAFASLLAPMIGSLNVGPAEADWIAFAVGFTVITFLHIVAGELAPKSLAIQKPLAVSLWVAKPLQWFYKLFYPAIWVLNHAAFWLLRCCGLPMLSENQIAHSEEEIRLILAQNRNNNSRASFGHTVALNAFDLAKRSVREVMRPRQVIVSLNTEETIQECLELAEHSRYSRFPLCRAGNLDQTLGVVHLKDLMSLRNKEGSGRDLQSVARKLVFVPETARLDKLLTLLLERRAHMAIVVDEYGGTLGMTTLEDILEALVGAIEDEFDKPKHMFQQNGDQSWELDAAMPLHDLVEFTGEPIKGAQQVSTVSGWVVQQLGRFPCPGEEIDLAGWTVRVEAVNEGRVTRARLSQKPERMPTAA